MIHRSEEFKKSAVQKFHSRGARNVEEIAGGLGVSPWSLYRWAKLYATSPGMKRPEKRPQDWLAAEKLKAVIEFEGLPEDKRGEYLRREGLHAEHLEAWKKSMQAGLEPAARSSAERGEMSELKARNKELERDVRRKDRALAETTALLVLKKKADLIWGTGESE
jgi:transposase-like protein